MLRLVREFGLALDDVLAPSDAGLDVAYVFNGRNFSEEEVI